MSTCRTCEDGYTLYGNHCYVCTSPLARHAWLTRGTLRVAPSPLSTCLPLPFPPCLIFWSTDSDFPVAFNIILWLGVATLLATVAICYAIGGMDPGRNSIIYRMTAQRIKTQ